jgi:hypothetical protein
MQPLRALLLGLGIAAASLVVCAVLLATLPKKLSFDGSEPLQAGTVLSREELEARALKAEAELAAARARVQQAGIANILRTDTASYFALVAPLALLVGALLVGKASLRSIAAYAAPVFVTSLLLGVGIQGVILILCAVLVVVALTWHTRAVASDA